MADAAETVKKTVEQTTAKAKAQAENIQAAGAKAWVVKPFQPAQMLAAVSKLILP